MRRTAISDMTLEQASDELVMMEVKKLLQKAKKAYKKAQEAEAAVFHVLEWDMCLDMDVPSEAENAGKGAGPVRCRCCAQLSRPRPCGFLFSAHPAHA